MLFIFHLGQMMSHLEQERRKCEAGVCTKEGVHVAGMPENRGRKVGKQRQVQVVKGLGTPD